MASKRRFIYALFMVALQAVSAKRFHSIAGPFRVELKRLERCPPGVLNGPNTLKLDYYVKKQHHQEPMYNANASMPFPWDDNLVAKAALASWSSIGGWKENALQITVKNVCKFLFLHLKKHAVYGCNALFGETLGCPFPPGLYRLSNYTMPPWFLESPATDFTQFFYGRYRGEVKLFTSTNEMVACERALFNLVPR